VQVLQVEALCWCGGRATHNARTLNGVMVVEGAQVVVGDTAAGDVVGYEVLCRRHHMRRMTALSKDAVLRAAGERADALPFEIAACPVSPFGSLPAPANSAVIMKDWAGSSASDPS